MTDVLKLIEDFPMGRTSRQLFRLLDIEHSSRDKTEINRELRRLLADELIELGADRKWRARSRRPSSAGEAVSKSSLGVLGETGSLVAASAHFHQKLKAGSGLLNDEAENISDAPKPASLIRYYKAALRSDPRGAIKQAEDRHGTAFQLISGSGSWWSSESHTGEIRASLDSLPDSFRQALQKRTAEDQAMAIGWPIAIVREAGVPRIIPVGLFAATWERSEEELVLKLETDDVLINPDWIKSAARSAGWTTSALEEVFSALGAVGLARDEFRGRLREAAARAIRGKLHGTQPVAQVDLDAEGIHDALGLFLPTEASFTVGAVKDLDLISKWSPERLAQTALAPFLGVRQQEIQDHNEPAFAINTGPLNAEQIHAVQSSTIAPLTVVTGPPGTGKSQAIVAIAASALAAGQSVLVASKNHQALDAVEQRLGEIAKETSFLVRTLDPARGIDQDMSGVLDAILQETTGSPGLPPEEATELELQGLAQQRHNALDAIETRRRLHCELGQYHERRSAIVKAREALGDGASVQTVYKPPGLWRRLWEWLSSLFRRQRNETGSVGKAMTLAEVDREIERLRNQLTSHPVPLDPMELTARIESRAPEWLARTLAVRCSLSTDAARALSDAQSDLQLHGEKTLDRALTATVVDHRPLWLASVLGTPKRIGLHDGLFDLVIFDEASQCDIGSALPVLARARRAVVVGDANQLAFISQVGAAQDRNLMAAQGLPIKGMGRYAQGSKSLFSLAEHSPGAVRIILRDQYRSAEDIVGYINDEFYSGKLRVAGDQDGMCVPAGVKPGLAWTDVPAPAVGTHGNVNSAEISAIRDHLHQLLIEQGYAGTVGVVSPFRDQVNKLHAALETALPQDVRDRAELRVGTVDAFQGQERDLILFSPVVHAGSANSTTTFLNRDARRMNVAISRARAVAHVFGDKSFAVSGKVRRLASLLDRIENPRSSGGEGVFDSEWERIVDAALRRRGLRYEPQYPIAGRRLDFAVFGKTGVKLDLEVDGRQFHQDTDGNRKLDDHWRDHQLKGLGWKVRRFWVDELQQDLEGCIDLVEQDLLG